MRERWYEKAIVLQTIIAVEKVLNGKPRCGPLDRWGKRAKTAKEKKLREVIKDTEKGEAMG